MSNKSEQNNYPGTQFPIVELNEVKFEDIDKIHTWLNDDKAKCWLDLGSGRQSLNKIQLFSLLTGGKTLTWLIGAPEEEPIGIVCINDYKNEMGTAEIWGVRGEYNGGPLNSSLSAFLAALATAFLDYERKVVSTWVVESNQLSLIMHRRLGMKEVGCLRLSHVIGEKRYDKILFDITKEEFFELYPTITSKSGKKYQHDAKAAQ